MKLNEVQEVEQIADWLGVELVPGDCKQITGINELHKVVPGDLSFADHPKYIKMGLGSEAGVLLLNELPQHNPQHKTLLLSDDPFRDYNRLIKRFKSFAPMLCPMGKNVELGENTFIAQGVVIGDNVSIGHHCQIHPNVVIYDHAQIGDNVIIHANTTIGADAYYYKTRPNGYDKLLSCGRVIIENDVEIGANCTIDRGVSGDTVIGAGTKIDNLVQIGHGVVIGKRCLLAAQTGVAGKTRIGNRVILWGQVGVSKDLIIGDEAVVYAKSGVKGDLEGGKAYFGTPAIEARQMMRQIAILKRLPDLWKRLKRIID